jgi:hypothetical protein
VTAAHDYDDLHHLVDRLTPRQAAKLRVLIASYPEFAPSVNPGSKKSLGQRLSVIGIWGVWTQRSV